MIHHEDAKTRRREDAKKFYPNPRASQLSRYLMYAMQCFALAFACSNLFGQNPDMLPRQAGLETVKAPEPPSGSKGISWTHKSNELQASSLTYSESCLYFIEKGDLVSLEASTGKTRWSYPLTDGKDSKPKTLHPARFNGPTLHKNRVYISDQDYNFHSIDTETGKCIWRVSLESMFQKFSTPEITTPTFGNGRLYVGTAGVRGGRSGKVYCIREEDGKVLWEHDADMTIQNRPALIGKILVTGGGSKKIGLDPETGALLWKYGMFKRGAGVHGDSHEWEGRVIFLTSNIIESRRDPLSGPIGSSGTASMPGQVFGFIVCLDATTGKEVWEFDSGSPGTLQLEQGVAVAPDVASLFGITGTRRLVVVDIKTGKERFKIDNPNKWSPALFKNRMFVATTAESAKISDCGIKAGVVAVHSLEDGRILHKYCRPDPLAVPPVIVEGSVMLAFWNEDKKQTLIVAVDPDTSKERWTLGVEGRIEGVPLVGKEGLFFPGERSIFCVR